MRLVEFAPTDKSDSGDVYSNVVTALSLLQNQILDNDLPAEVPTNIVIKYIQTTGLTSFNYHSLVDANEAEESIRNIVKNITPDHITFVTGPNQSVDNPQDYVGANKNPEQTVSGMAKSAMKCRQKPLF